MDLLAQLRAYHPYNPQEARDLSEFYHRLQQDESLYDRSNLSAHLTASAWVTSPDHQQILMAYHNLYNSWAWLGGHADGERDLLSVALREVAEESGVEAHPISEKIFSLEILPVFGHEKQGIYVPSHLHLNVTFLLEADPTLPIRSKADENSQVAWFSPENAIAASCEPWFRERVYAKLNQKLATFPFCL